MHFHSPASYANLNRIPSKTHWPLRGCPHFTLSTPFEIRKRITKSTLHSPAQTNHTILAGGFVIYLAPDCERRAGLRQRIPACCVYHIVYNIWPNIISTSGFGVAQLLHTGAQQILYRIMSRWNHVMVVRGGIALRSNRLVFHPLLLLRFLQLLLCWPLRARRPRNLVCPPDGWMRRLTRHTRPKELESCKLLVAVVWRRLRVGFFRVGKAMREFTVQRTSNWNRAPKSRSNLASRVRVPL